MSTTATEPAAAEAAEVMEVVMAFSSVEEYRAMGERIAAVRDKLDLPAWTTPTEVIAAALLAVL